MKCNRTGILTEVKGHVFHKHKDNLRCTYVRMLGLSKPTVGKYSEDKKYVDTHNLPCHFVLHFGYINSSATLNCKYTE